MKQLKETEWVCTCGTSNVIKKERKNAQCPKCGRTRDYIRRYETKPEDKTNSSILKSSASESANPTKKECIEDEENHLQMKESKTEAKQKNYESLCGVGWVVLALSCMAFFAPPSEFTPSGSITLVAYLTGANIFNLIALAFAIPNYRVTKGWFSGLLILSATVVMVISSIRLIG